ncbi:MAG TPA: endonuclease/exonuclease/phosphatase family protein, partial [Lysobacter sp.]
SLLVAVAHLSLAAGSRLAQLSFIAELLHDHPNAVLMGDFNCGIEAPEMGVLFRATRLQPPACTVPTFPSWRPLRAIDHILIGDGLRCSDTCALAAAQSDHLALSLQLEVPERVLR